jgi:Putative prokaryotic signal transducing protein
LKILTTVSNDLEASLITGRLQEAGIHSIQRSEQLPQYTIGPYSVLVEDDDYTRAREILAQDEGGFDENELARLSDQAAEDARARAERSAQAAASTPETGKPRHWLRRILRVRAG